MGPIIVIEVLDAAGRVRERTRHERLPVTIGRGYQNDVILDDPYISPQHLSLDQDARGELNAVDLQSENGVFLYPSLRRVEQAAVGPETLLRIGRTCLRIHTPAHSVAPTALDQSGPQASRAFMNSGWIFAAVMVLTAGVIVLEQYSATYTHVRFVALLLPALLVIAALSGWAGLWALASRLYAHHSAYFAHGVIAGLATTGLYLLGTVHAYYSFAFSAALSGALLQYTGVIVILGLLLYGHLRLCVLHSAKSLAAMACVVAVLIVSLSGLTSYVYTSEFSDDLRYPAQLKPPAFKMVKSATLDDFIERAQGLKSKVDRQAQEE
ncbi:MAG: FHA domain-containing protein [Nitrospiraceae bacterium]